MVTGVKFPKSRTKHLCKTDVYADKITDVDFSSPDAIRPCRCLCEGYQDTMIIDVGVKVKGINANCDYTGATIIKEHSANETHSAKCPDLSTPHACVPTTTVATNIGETSHIHINCKRKKRKPIVEIQLIICYI